MLGVGGVGVGGVFGCGGCGACCRERVAALSSRLSMRTKLAMATGSSVTSLRGGLTMLNISANNSNATTQAAMKDNPTRVSPPAITALPT